MQQPGDETIAVQEAEEPAQELSVKDKKLLQLARRVDSSELASIKGVVTGIVKMINRSDSNVKDLKELIQIDPPLSAKILKVANSAYYASPRTISEIDQAIIWIGFDALKEIVLTQKVGEIFSNAELVEGYSREMLWKHSLAVAILVKLIYRREFGQKGETAYAAGLVHDIGIIVLDQLMHPDFVRIMGEAKKQRQTISQAESIVLGYDHADIGKVLTRHWNFPVEMCKSIGFHHEPETEDPQYARLAKTLFIADWLAFESGHTVGQGKKPGQLVFEKYTDDLKLSSYALKSIVHFMQQDLARIEDKGVFKI